MTGAPASGTCRLQGAATRASPRWNTARLFLGRGIPAALGAASVTVPRTAHGRLRRSYRPGTSPGMPSAACTAENGPRCRWAPSRATEAIGRSPLRWVCGHARRLRRHWSLRPQRAPCSRRRPRQQGRILSRGPWRRHRTAAQRRPPGKGEMQGRAELSSSSGRRNAEKREICLTPI
uniref:Uncharacterized protein n=1 Tax=Tetraselmis sp. GSL018 TaxID=582737 RepID=A0A061RX21_9CHLO